MALSFLRRGDREYATAKVPEGTSGVDGDQYSDYEEALAGGTDLNPLWAGRAKYDLIEEMRKSDAAIKSLLYMVKLPLRSAEWSVTPFHNGKDPIDRLIAEAVEAQFGLDEYEGWLDLSHDELLNQDCLMLDFGAMFEEMIFADKPVKWSPLDDGGAERLIRPIVRLAPRYPATVFRLTADKRLGTITKIEQDLPDAEPIPGGKIVPYVLDREGDWFGTSMLRACYGSWRMKKAMMISSAIGWDRYAAGTPVVRYPMGGGEKAKKEATEIGRNYRTHERAYVTLEGPEPGAAGGEWGFKIESGAQSLADPVPLLRHYDSQIAMSVLQQFKDLGNTATGSRAVADVQQGPYWLALQTIARGIAQARRRYAIRKFVDVNFGTEYKTPEFKVSKLQAKDLATLSTVIANLSSANLTFTDRDTQDDIRDLMELRHLPEETAKVIQDSLDQLPDPVGVAATLKIPQEGDSIAPPPGAVAPAAGSAPSA